MSSNQFPSFIDPSLNLPPPGGMDHIDDDEGDDSDRYELWTFRVPSTMNVSDLDGVEIDMDAIRKNKNSGGMKVSDGKYAVSLGDGVENKNFRVLVPSHRNYDDDDDDDSSSSNSEDESNGNKETNKFLLRPASKAFSRHLNIHTTELLRKSEAELAPLEGPEPTDDVLRHAYSHIPQRKGLKRRWMPLGAPQSAKDIPSKLITLQPDRAASAGVSAPVSSDDDNNQKPRRKSVGSNKNRSAEPGGDAQPTSSVTPKTKRIKKEKGSGSKSSEKSAKKSSKKSKKHRKQSSDALSV